MRVVKEAEELFSKLGITEDQEEIEKEIICWLEQHPDCYDIEMEDYNFTPFFMACFYDAKLLFRYLEDKNINVHYRDEYKRNALHVAIVLNHTHFIEKLCKKGIDINACDYRGNTPLIQASMYGFTDSIKELLKFGADVNMKNHVGNDLLYYIENKIVKFDSQYLMNHFHLFNEENQKRIKKMRVRLLFN